MKVRTRMAPSPTGELHIGGLRTALYNYAWAKKNHGQFILRIEDTDQERLVPGAIDRLLKIFLDFSLSWDEGPEAGGKFAPYIQSERLPVYKKYALELIKNNHAYYCFCTKERLEKLRKTRVTENKLPGYDRHCRNLTPEEVEKNIKNDLPFTIRMKIPDHEEIIFEDIAHGTIKTNSDSLDDQILLKSDGFPTYHLAVVVDDHLMEITHIIRANEWISSTPKHVLLYRYFGWEMPRVTHLSVFLDPEGQGKMSKRKGSVSAKGFLDEGYLPEAMLNYLMLLGWNPGTERELYTLSEFIEAFDLKDLNKSNQKFTYDKLNWFNQQYIRALSDTDLAPRLQRFTSRSEADITKVLQLVRDRLVTLKDFDKLTSYFFETPKVSRDLFSNMNIDPEPILKHALTTLEKNWDGKYLETEARKYCAENNLKVGDYFMVLRISVTGITATPPLWDIMEVIGQEESLTRLNNLLTLEPRT